MRLILARHGETEENKEKICQGWLPGKLSQLGLLQAQKLAQRFENEKIDFFYCSDLDRAKDTLAKISVHHQNVPVIYTPALREKGGGEYEGKPVDIKYEAIAESQEGMLYCKIRGIESGIEALTRSAKLIDTICKKHEGKTVLAVTHNTLLSLLFSFYTGDLQNHQDKRLYNPKSDYSSGNTGVAEFELLDCKLELVYFNCMKHLD